MALNISQDPKKALILFVDVINSSKFSSVLTYKKYFELIEGFQNEFKLLGSRYFPSLDKKEQIVKYRLVDSRGDEGIVFVIDTSAAPRSLLSKAIEFIYHLKGRLRFSRLSAADRNITPTFMGLAAGLHYGNVAFATGIDPSTNHSIIAQIEGYSINFAKRLESNARLGKYSNIILSKVAAKYLEGSPIVLSPIYASMKGIEDSEEMYEIESGLFDHMNIDGNDAGDEYFLDRLREEIELKPYNIDKQWLKTLVISVLESLTNLSPVPARKNEYFNRASKFAWHSADEEDPILLYQRSIDYRLERKHTQEIRYLKQIMDKYPGFLFARKQIVKAFYQMFRNKIGQHDRIYCRDIAEEFLQRFLNDLDPDEIKEFKNIIKRLGDCKEKVLR